LVILSITVIFGVTVIFGIIVDRHWFVFVSSR
jgi:hypothetical protein